MRESGAPMGMNVVSRAMVAALKKYRPNMTAMPMWNKIPSSTIHVRVYRFQTRAGKINSKARGPHVIAFCQTLIDFIGGCQGTLGIHNQVRSKFRVVLVDSIQIGLGHLDRRDFFALNLVRYFCE